MLPHNFVHRFRNSKVYGYYHEHVDAYPTSAHGPYARFWRSPSLSFRFWFIILLSLLSFLVFMSFILLLSFVCFWFLSWVLLLYFYHIALHIVTINNAFSNVLVNGLNDCHGRFCFILIFKNKLTETEKLIYLFSITRFYTKLCEP